MIVDINSMVERLYQKSYEKIFQVYEVFKDYFDEERVDLQGIPTLEVFKERSFLAKYNNTLSFSTITATQAWNETSEQDREIIRTLCSSGALNTYIGSDNTVFKYLFPFIFEKYDPTRINNVYIIVHFPEVRVANEYDKYVDIKELYARVKITIDGHIEGTFGLLRADYPVSHLYADYAHSHISGVTLTANEFKSPCLGTGPINRTIVSLVADFDLNMWMLFCRELDTYVTVESLGGGPYRRLENITGKRQLRKISQRFSDNIHLNRLSALWANYLPLPELKNFISYLLRKKVIKFNYNEGSYNLAMSFKDYIVEISNSFIDWVNNYMDRNTLNTITFKLENLLNVGILGQYSIQNGIIYSFSTSSRSLHEYLSYNGRDMLLFKGNRVRLNVYDDTINNDENVVHLLKFELCEMILTYMLTYINYSHGKELSNTEVGSCKKCIIL